jgi:hypothetical protein
VRSLEPAELRRALGVVTELLLSEVHETAPELAARLKGPLLEATRG